MPTHKVTFLPFNKSIDVEDGEILIRAAMQAGVHINASCGGEGVCGKCRVIVEQGTVDGGISDRLGREDVDKNIRQACISRVVNDISVRIPVESEVDASVLELKTPRRTAEIKEMNLNDLKEQGLFLPPVEKTYLQLPEASAVDNLPDVTRLVSHLKSLHDEHHLRVDLSVIQKIPHVLRKDDFKVTATLLRPVRSTGGRTRIVNIQSGDTTDRNYAVAMDIGTTTVYAQILDLLTGEVISQYGMFNKQISYGEDVISRIVFAEKPGGLDKLNEAIIETINIVIEKSLERAKMDADEVSTLTLAGNTTMTQLLLKVPPNYLRRSPYVPAATLFPPIEAAELGIRLPSHVTALVYPAVSSYVGGDIVSGVMGSGMYRTEALTLYMDIGTNAEIVIGNKDWLACAAASAGPAFEGGGIKFGMRAAKGAIEDFSINPLTYEPMNLTIGNVRPKGICGSGLITLVALLFELGVIDNQGKLNRNLDTPRIRQKDDIWEYVLAWADETQVERDIAVTEPDIDNLIRAKGAMYGACMTLLEEVGLSVSDIDHIILAGGFGSFVDLEKAMTIGLLPEVDPARVTYVGNGSLMGAKMSALTNRIRRDVVETTRKMTNFELSETKSYMDNYVAALFLPHTDLNHFPNIQARLAARRQTT